MLTLKLNVLSFNNIYSVYIIYIILLNKYYLTHDIIII